MITSPTEILTMAEIGNAKEAADVLGVSLSQFNHMRLLDTYTWEPQGRSRTKIDPTRDDLREFLQGKHLVAPAYAGRRPAGGSWTFNLTRLRKYQEHGWPGAEYPTCDDQSS